MYEVHRRARGSTIHRQVLNGCWPAAAMVMEGINVEDIFLTCLLGSFIIDILDI